MAASDQEKMQAEALFNQNFAAIQKAKQQTGDWEKAYQMVVGRAWPKGQNVEINPNGTASIIKDEPWIKDAAKFAIPAAGIALAPFTGGATMAALLGAGTGAASGALSGGGWKGALMGAGMGAAGGWGANKIGGMIAGKLGTDAAAKAAGSAVSNLDDLGGFVGPTLEQASGSFTGPLLEQAGSAAMNRAGGSGGGGSWISKLLGKGKDLVTGGPEDGVGSGGQNWTDLASTIGAYGQAEASNRFARGNFMQNYDQLSLGFDRQNLARESDAMKKLAQTGYILGGGRPYQAPALRSGQTVDLGYGPMAPSAAQQQGARTLEGTLLTRLTPEGMLKPTDPNTYVKEGVGEKIAKYGSLGAGSIGAIRGIWG